MSDIDFDAPEEFTVEQGMQQDEEITKVQIQNKARVVREGKERRRKWAQKLTPRPSRKEESTKDKTEAETLESEDKKEMLPDEIVQLLAAREKKVFTSDSEDENVEKKPSSRKRRPNRPGVEPVILKDMPPALCVQNSLDF